VPLPVVMPLLGAALTLVIVRRPAIQRAVSLSVLSATVAVAATLLVLTTVDGPLVVAVGGWAARSGSCWSPTSSPR
jgi:multicomponent Na+:H+ antiporter subunit D